MTRLLVQEDLYWRQRAKAHRYKEGDLNTKFFHASATARKKVNKISFQSSEVIEQARIHSLIDHESNTWNHQLISYYFDDAVVQDILKTPLFSQVPEDQLIWNLEKNGHYSVRSAYRLCMEVIADNSFLHCPGNSSSIWKLKVPPKVRNMLWRICRECLPTRAQLLDKGVNCPSTCAIYV